MFSRLFVAWSLKRESKVSVKHVSVKRISVKHISVKHVSVKQVSLKQQITTRTTPCSLDSQNMFSGYSSSIATIFACLDSLTHIVGFGRVSSSEVGGVRRNLYIPSTPTCTHRAATVHPPIRPLCSPYQRFLDIAPTKFDMDRH